MKAFKFSLQVVLDEAVTQKDECALKLKETSDAIKKVEHERAALHNSIVSCEKKLYTNCNANGFKQIKVYIDELSKRDESLKKELDRLEIIKMQRLEDLKKAKIKCSAFEKIREKKYSQFLDSIKKYEEREIEELINNKYISKAD
ncbi:MAG: flagellar export protein FliJ [Clostridia bacterium]|jgi:flagellar export protein FliJ